MQKEQIVVGKSYVNEHACIVREVVEEVDGRRVKFNTFDLATGKLIPTRHKVWNKAQLARWADREASVPETTRVHPYESGAGFNLLFPPEQAGTSLEHAKATMDKMPGHHTFPVGK